MKFFLILKKRNIYDNYGEEGLKGGGFTRPEDLFSQMFGGGGFFGGGRRQQTGPKRVEDTCFKLTVSLKDMYNSRTKKLRIPRSIICNECNGRGSTKEGVDIRCNSCKGQGTKVVTRQLGPGMIQQMQSVCPDCKGSGEVIDPKLRCKECNGNKLVEIKELIEVCIDKGMKDGEKIVFYEKGEQSPGSMTGDLIIVLAEEKDEHFTRKGNDLFYEHTLTLSEALTGYEFLITHMDDRKLFVHSTPLEIVKPGDLRVIIDEGMPFHKSPFDKGRLIIKFNVLFPTPDQMLLANVKKVEALLPPKPKLSTNVIADGEEVYTREFQPMDYEQSRQQDGEEQEGETRTQCVHQ